jgi:hypothetical protein
MTPPPLAPGSPLQMYAAAVAAGNTVSGLDALQGAADDAAKAGFMGLKASREP